MSTASYWNCLIISPVFTTEEAVYNAYKLSYFDGAEGELIWPPPPWQWSDDGEHDPEMKLMPLSHMERFRSACEVKDERPANEWLQAVVQALVAVLWQQMVSPPRGSVWPILDVDMYVCMLVVCVSMSIPDVGVLFNKVAKRTLSGSSLPVCFCNFTLMVSQVLKS